MSEIHILPEFIANQIAAGEVVQRPESVVKELVENALDAGANTIAVLVRGSGKNLIHVVDNGKGMSREDLALAAKRHATSKIFSQDDLDEIRTFGFRGEALASISSIAQLEIRTRTAEEPIGYKLISEPMKEDIIEPMMTEHGTQIFVRNLFFNVPARRKFLKSNLTEFRYISDTMIKFALAKPDVRMTFYDEDTLIFDVKPATLEQRVSDLLGDTVGSALIKVRHQNEYITISGFIGLPHIAKQSRAGQFLYMNGRSILSKSLNHSVFSSYEHLLENKANPFYILNLELDPKVVDVNVHPQKHEVKFEDERYIYNSISKAVRLALESNNLAPDMKFANLDAQTPFEKLSFSDNSKPSDLMLVNKITGEVIEPNSYQARYTGNHEIPFHQGSHTHSYTPPPKDYQHGEVFPKGLSAFEALFGKSDEQTGSLQNTEHVTTNLADKPIFNYWTLHKKYIFTQTHDGMMMIDQHAAHERVLYEKAIKAMNKVFAYSQNLLFPVRFQLSSSEVSIVQELADDLNNLGYDIKLLDNGQIELNGVPSDIRSGDEESSLREIIEQYQENNSYSHTDKRDYLAATFSCKAAIKTGHYLNNQEIKHLLEELFACKTPYVCPHGRPIIIEFSLQEFDKRFGRL
jgi:DNA mismatch repair protein MutL